MSDYKLNVSNVTNIYYRDTCKTFYQNSISKFYRVGDIKFDSKKGEGTTFYIIIPLINN